MREKLIIIAPDSFKGSLSSGEYCRIAQNTLEKLPGIAVKCFPMADGGEGTAEIIQQAIGASPKKFATVGADGTDIEAEVQMLPDGTAVLESALVVGLNMPSTLSVPLRQRATEGIGILIDKLYNEGTRCIRIGIGGTGTNDGGFGMLKALGCQFNGGGKTITEFNQLDSLQEIDFTPCLNKYKNLRIQFFSDVDNPLCGKRGATLVFGPQKGLGDDFDFFECRLKAMGESAHHALGVDIAAQEGSGAAGGLGFAFRCIGGEYLSGADFFISLHNLGESIAQAELVITGEGRSDSQTAYGKLPARVAKIAGDCGVPCVLLSGSIDLESVTELRKIFSGCFSISHGPCTLEESLANSSALLESSLASLAGVFLASSTNQNLNSK